MVSVLGVAGLRACIEPRLPTTECCAATQTSPEQIAQRGSHAQTGQHNSRMNEATRLYTKVFLTLTGTWADTSSFRRIVVIGQPHAERQLAAEHTGWFARFIEEPANDRLFIDKAKFSVERGGADGLAAQMTANELNAFRRSVDAASLVFMHSALDAAVEDLCRVTALVAPLGWQPFLDDRKERLGDVRGKGYDTLFAEHLQRSIAALSRESLLKKVDRLFQLCRPGPEYGRAGYVFDRNRLTALDALRHQVVHGDRVREPIDGIDDALHFLLETGLFLFGLPNHRWGLQISGDDAR
jgi:hypothetical protein